MGQFTGALSGYGGLKGRSRVRCPVESTGVGAYPIG